MRVTTTEVSTMKLYFHLSSYSQKAERLRARWSFQRAIDEVCLTCQRLVAAKAG